MTATGGEDQLRLVSICDYSRILYFSPSNITHFYSITMSDIAVCCLMVFVCWLQNN